MNWLVVATPGPRYGVTGSSLPEVALAGGALFTLLVVAYVFVDSRRRSQLSALARAERDLAERLERSRNYFSALVLNSSDVITLVDAEGNVGYASPSTVRVLGHEPESLAGMPVAGYVHGEDLAELERLMALGADHESPGVVELRLRHDDGSWRTVETVVTNLAGAPGVEGIVLNSRDVTERQRLLDAVANAEELDRLKSEFVGLASHELRTPLTGIFGFSSLLANSKNLAAQEQQWAAYFHQEATHLTAITTNLLNVSRIEAGEVDVDSSDLMMAELVEAVTQPFEEFSATHPIVVEGDPAAMVRGDRDKLIEVIRNLVDNAIKYSPEGGEVRVEWTVGSGEVALRIEDHGLGIPGEHVSNLFQRFGRIERDGTQDIRSTGLGLYIVRRFVDLMDGQIRVESAEGVGSTFTVTLRQAAASRAA